MYQGGGALQDNSLKNKAENQSKKIEDKAFCKDCVQTKSIKFNSKKGKFLLWNIVFLSLVALSLVLAFSLSPKQSNQLMAVNGTLTKNADGEYEISDYNDLIAFRDLVNGGDNCSGKTFVLTKDIEISDTSWTPIGYYNGSKAFSGTFDGQGNSIIFTQLVEYSTEGSNYGFFCEIKNSQVKNCNFNFQQGLYENTAYYAFASVIAKCDSSTISKVNVICDLSMVGTVSGAVSLLVGRCFGDNIITECSVSGDVDIEADGDSTPNFGGMVGYVVDGTIVITNCSNYANFSFNGSIYNHVNAGGILGTNESGEVNIKDCYNYGNFNVQVDCRYSADNYVGGIFGGYYYTYRGPVVISNCYNVGSMICVATSSGVGYSDAIAFDASIYNCIDFYSGKIYSEASIGTTTFKNAYVNGSYSNVLSENDSTIDSKIYIDGNLLSNSSLSASQKANVKRILIRVINTKLGQKCLQKSDFVVGGTNIDIWNSSYLWDFANVWEIGENGFLQFKGEPAVNIISFSFVNESEPSTIMIYLKQLDDEQNFVTYTLTGDRTLTLETEDNLNYVLIVAMPYTWRMTQESGSGTLSCTKYSFNTGSDGAQVEHKFLISNGKPVNNYIVV